MIIKYYLKLIRLRMLSDLDTRVYTLLLAYLVYMLN